MSEQSSQLIPVKRALLSVSDKTGIIELATALQQLGVEILSTGGTARLLQEHHIPVTEVSNYTGFPEIMDGRVKTLHPKIHGGLLRRPGIDDEVLQQHAIQPIDLVVVNLYPFSQTLANPANDFATIIENIDIGGPTMLRASAKNFAAVSVVVNPEDYAVVLDELKTQNGHTRYACRQRLAKRAFTHTAAYEAAIANYFNTLGDAEPQVSETFPEHFTSQLQRQQCLRYGENPHQQAAFYTETNPVSGTVSHATQLQGKALSFNNIADADTALECVKQFQQPACVIVKHANPCGVAVAADLTTAYQRAFTTDPTSAFGGIIAFNQPLDAATAQAIIDKQFVEVIIAPEITPEALTVLSAKPNVRVLNCGAFSQKSSFWDYKRINGGLLVQEADLAELDPQQLKIVSARHPNDQEMRDLCFAWQVAKFVKSNAIVYTRDAMTIGIGAGQMSRVVSARIAALKAADENLTVTGSVMASDAFFPFRDGIDAAAAAGIRAVIQPGGSIRDEEVIAAADEADIAMVFTGIRHFRH